jgi:hypothetical protein
MAGTKTLFLTGWGRNYLLAASTLKPGSKAMQDLVAMIEGRLGVGLFGSGLGKPL